MLQVLLLDEITVDLDVLGRADLLAYLRAETEERGACIVYATHIFDGLESWATHLMYLADGGLKARSRRRSGLRPSAKYCNASFMPLQGYRRLNQLVVASLTNSSRAWCL